MVDVIGKSEPFGNNIRCRRWHSVKWRLDPVPRMSTQNEMKSIKHSQQSKSPPSMTRNPQLLLRRVFPLMGRLAERQFSASLCQEPPRRMRNVPFSGVNGSLIVPVGYFSYQSEHHSHTLPCMSCKPQELAGNLPTIVVFLWYGPLFFVPNHPFIAG